MDKLSKYRMIHLIKLEGLVEDAGMIILRDTKTKAMTDIIFPEIDMDHILQGINKLPADCQVEALNYEDR